MCSLGVLPASPLISPPSTAAIVAASSRRKCTCRHDFFAPLLPPSSLRKCSWSCAATSLDSQYLSRTSWDIVITRRICLSAMGMFRTFSLGLFAVLAAVLYAPVAHVIRVGGIFRTPQQMFFPEGHGPIHIEDTIHCEDVHHYRPANLLFAACEDSKMTRIGWFPPLDHFSKLPTTPGSIHVIDPKVRCAKHPV